MTKYFLILVSCAIFAAGFSTVSFAQDKPMAEPNNSNSNSKNYIVKINIQGNRKVDDAAIRGAISSKPGQVLHSARVASDVRAIWSLGYFDDVEVSQLNTSAGIILVYVVKEKPSIRKIYVSGNDEVDLDKINEVLNLKKDAILDVSQVKHNLEKIRDLYTEKGFFLAEIQYEIKKVSKTEVDIYYRVEENAKVTIRRITLVGNKNISSKEIKGSIGTQEGGFFSWLTSSGTYSEEGLERDAMMISALYYDHGYVEVKVGKPQVVLSPDKKYIYITINIDEGKQYYIGKLDVKGDLLWSRQQMLTQLSVKQGELFSRSKLAKDIMKITDNYKDEGYAYVNVSPLTNLDPQKRTVDLTLEVQKGQKVMVERINIHGNSKTEDRVIRREMKISEGDQYSQTLLNLSKARVTKLGFFENVEVSTSRGSQDDRITINVEVKERPTGTFQIGAGFSSAENFIAQAQISQNNLFGRGQRLSLQAQMSGLRQLFSLSFWEPYFFDTRWTFGFELYNRTYYLDSFSRNSVGGDLTWGYPLADDVNMYLTYTAEMIDVTTSGRGTLFGSGFENPLPSGVRIANLFRNGFTSSAKLSIAWDTRDNRLFPTKGFWQSAWAEFASPYTGSENIFNRYGGFSRWYYPIWGPIVFKFNGQMSYVTSSDKMGVPIFERIFVGGIMDVRGFRPRSLGPRIPVLSSPDPGASIFYFNKGGNKELVFNWELEFPIFEKVGIKGVVFSDAGMAYDDNENITLSGLRHSVGMGFRWFSPIGPLRFEWGFPLSPEAGEDPMVFEFTIGNPF